MIELKNLSHSIGQQDVLCSLDHQFEQGQYGLIGEHGAGKTTLLKLIATLIQPTQGFVRSLLPSCYLSSTQIDFGRDLIVEKYIKHAKNLYSVSNKGLDDFWNVLNLELDGKRIGDLSLENRQKLLLLPLFSQNQHWYLLDEVLSNIDSSSKENLASYLHSKESSYIIASRDVYDILRFSKKIILTVDQKLYLIDPDELSTRIGYVVTVLAPDGQTEQYSIDPSQLEHLVDGRILQVQSVLDI